MRTTPRHRRALAGLVGTTLALTVPVWAATSASAAVGACAGTPDTSIDLYTASGTVALNATGSVSAPVWGYSQAANATLTAPGGPLLTATKGQTVQVTLHNGLGVTSSLSLPQLDGFVDDAAGAAAGGTREYCFTPQRAGTYLYQAGATPTGARQVAMGMAGILVVRPAAGETASSIDGSGGTVYADEAPLLLQEIDPALNAAPTTFDMRLYAPKYRLINGKTFPRTAAADHVVAHPGTVLALRIVNAGIVEHSLGALGLRQKVVALGSNPLTYPEDVVAETLQAGGTMDALVSVPAAGPSTPTSYLLYETAAGNGVSSLQSFSGMATTIDAAAPAVDPNAPSVTGLAASPASVAAGTPVSVTGTASATTTGLQWQLDGVGAWTAATTFPIGVPTTGLAPGTHTVYVRATDGTLTGAAATVTFTVTGAGATVDTAGPLVTGTTVSPVKVKGADAVSLSATADDRTTGGSNVSSATFALDGGAATAMTLNRTDNPVAALTATTSSTAGGHHTVTVLAKDALGNVTATAGTAAFDVDATPPTTSTVVVSPGANNGTLESRVGSGVFSVSAVVTDPTVAGVGGSIGYGEAFIDNASGAVGTGFAMVPGTGVDTTNATTAAAGATVVADIPLSQVTGLTNGTHTIFVRGRDGVGNWSTTMASGTFLVDKLAPAVNAPTVAPNRGASTVTVTVTAADTGGAGFAGAGWGEAWAGATDPGPGNGTRLTLGASTTTSATFTGSVPVPVPASGSSTVALNLRVRDAAGNVSAVRTTNVTVTANQLFSNGFEPVGSPFGWSTRTGTTPTRTTTAGQRIAGAGSGTLSLGGSSAGYVVDTTPAAEIGYHASFALRSLPTGTSSTVFPVFRASSTTSATGTEVFRVEYRHPTATGTQLRLVAAGAAATAWLPVTDGAVTTVRVDWTRAGATLVVGAGTQSVSFATASTASVETVTLGRTTAASTGLGGSLVLDSFVSARDHLPLP